MTVLKRPCPLCTGQVMLDPRGWPTHMRFKHNLKTKAAIERAINRIQELSNEDEIPPNTVLDFGIELPILDNAPMKSAPMTVPFAITNTVGKFIEATYLEASRMKTRLVARRAEIQTELQEIELMLTHLSTLTIEPPDFVEEAESRISTAA